MLKSIVLPFLDYLVFIIPFVHILPTLQKNLLIICTVLTKFLQIVFVEQRIPYNSKFNRQNPIIQYIYPHGKPFILFSH